MDYDVTRIEEGSVFGRWRVLALASGGKHPLYLCRCECGTRRLVHGRNLERGLSRSCGCLRSEILRELRLGPAPYVRHGPRLAGSVRMGR